jgi:hypothetical protein
MSVNFKEDLHNLSSISAVEPSNKIQPYMTSLTNNPRQKVIANPLPLKSFPLKQLKLPHQENIKNSPRDTTLPQIASKAMDNVNPKARPHSLSPQPLKGNPSELKYDYNESQKVHKLSIDKVPAQNSSLVNGSVRTNRVHIGYNSNLEANLNYGNKIGGRTVVSTHKLGLPSNKMTNFAPMNPLTQLQIQFLKNHVHKIKDQVNEMTGQGQGACENHESGGRSATSAGAGQNGVIADSLPDNLNLNLNQLNESGTQRTIQSFDTQRGKNLKTIFYARKK